MNGLENVIYAANLLQTKPVKFIFVGDGPQKNRLKKLCGSLKNIDFYPPVSKLEMPLLISKCDLVLISLAKVSLFRYGISPNKLYDAYASGRPVLTTVDGQINDEVELNNLGLACSAEDPEELSKKNKNFSEY